MDKIYYWEDLQPDELAILMETGLSKEENYKLFFKTKQLTEAVYKKNFDIVQRRGSTVEALKSCKRSLIQVIASHKNFRIVDSSCSDWRTVEEIYQQYSEWIKILIKKCKTLIKLIDANLLTIKSRIQSIGTNKITEKPNNEIPKERKNSKKTDYEFQDYLNEKGLSILPHLITHYKDNKTKNIFFMLLALEELGLMNTPKGNLFEKLSELTIALQNTLGNVGDRQGFVYWKRNFSMSYKDEAGIKKHIRIISNFING